MWAVVVGGLLALIALATAVGLAVDRQARREAWGRIATSRRINAENRRELEGQSLAQDVREADLDLRERRVEFREERLFRFEEEMRQLEDGMRRPQPPPELTA